VVGIHSLKTAQCDYWW